MKIVFAAVATTLSVMLSTPVQAGPTVDPTLPNIVPIFPQRPGTSFETNFIITPRLGTPTLEWEILTANIGGQDWVRPPINRAVTCTSPTQYFRMPETHEYRVYWFDPDAGEYVQVDQRRKRTICVWDDSSRSGDSQITCQRQHASNFTCGCNSPMYGPGTGNGVSQGWADSYYRGLTGQWASLAGYTGDFLLTTEFDPDQVLQATDLLDRERDATHDDNISYVYFSWDGVGVQCGANTCVTNVLVQYSFTPVCG